MNWVFVIAPTGAGKSMVLVHLAAEALKAGKTVVYYTLELKDTVVGGRFDSNLSGIPLTNSSIEKRKSCLTLNQLMEH